MKYDAVGLRQVFLLLFAQVHYFASNPLHAGAGEILDSIRRIFGAMLGDISKEDNRVLENRYTCLAT